MKKVLIVGGTGYLGRKVLNKLKSEGYDVTCTYLLGENISNIDNDTIKFILCDIKVIEEELHTYRYDWIMNFAALYEKADTKVLDIVNVNTVLGIQLLSLACDKQVKNVLTVDTALPENVNWYSYTKKKVSEFGRYITEKCGVNIINLQPEMFYGEDEPENRFIPSSIRKMKNNETLELTEGKQLRDIIHVSDVVNIIYEIIERKPEGYNDVPIGTGEGVSIREIIEYLHNIMDTTSILKFGAIPSRDNEPSCVADTDKLYSIIGEYKFIYNWKTGLEACIGKRG